MNEEFNEELAAQLAAATGFEPSEILDYRLKDDGTYNVILYDMRKLTGVVPVASLAAESDNSPDEIGQNLDLPDALERAYNRPNRATRKELLALAEHFSLPVDPTATRATILVAVETYKNQLPQEAAKD